MTRVARLSALALLLAGRSSLAADAPRSVPPGVSPAAARLVDPDAGWFAVAHVGLIRLSRDGFELFGEIAPSVPKELAEDALAELAARVKRIPDSIAATTASAFTLSSGGLGHAEGGDLKLDVPDPPGTVRCCLRIDPAGNPWMLANDVLGHRDATGKWVFQKTPELGLTYGKLRDLALDGKGEPWLATSEGLRFHTAAGWQTAATGDQNRFLAVAANGTSIVAATPDVILRLKGSAVAETIPLERSWMSEELVGLSLTKDGDLVLAAQSGTVLVVPAGGQPHTYVARDFKATTVRSIATDERRRVWVATDNGLAIISGGKVTLYPMGSIPTLAGAIVSMAIIGRGPDLPDPVEPRKLNVTGKFLQGVAPAANYSVLLCPHPTDTHPDDPCAGNAAKFQTTTDAQGVYHFTGVPLGGYVRSWKGADGSWTVIDGDNRAVRGTEDIDLGELDIK